MVIEGKPYLGLYALGIGIIILTWTLKGRQIDEGFYCIYKDSAGT